MSKIEFFFNSLLSPEGEVSSKRFSGLLLIALFIITTIIAASTGNINESVESLIKTALYTGTGLLGINIVEGVMTTIKRPVQNEEPS